MAPSSSDVSTLKSTSRLFSCLDLNNEHHQENMEEIDIDQIMEVHDTPNRLMRRINMGEDLSIEINPSLVGDSGKYDLLDNGAPSRARSRFRPTCTNRNNVNNRKLTSRRLGDPNVRVETDQMNHTAIFVADSPPFIPKSARSSRKTMEEQVFKESASMLSALPHGHGGSRDVAKFGHGSSSVAEVLSLDPNNQKKLMKETIPKSSLNCDIGKATYTEIPSKESRKGLIGCSSRGTSNSSKASDNVYEGKTNIDDATQIPSVAVSHNAKCIDLSCDPKPKADQITVKSFMTPTRNTGRRRLVPVLNGCISPNNTAKARHTYESHVHSFKDGQNDNNVISNDRIPTEIHNLASNIEGNQSVRMDKTKGKGVMVDPPRAKEYGGKTLHLSGRSLNSTEEDNGIRDANEDDSRCSKEIDGWRSTRSRSRVTSSELPDEFKHHSGRGSGFGYLLDQSRRNRTGNENSTSAIDTSPEIDILGASDQVSFQQRPANSIQASLSAISQSIENGRHGRVIKLTKRQRKQPPVCSNLGECSTSDFDDSEISYLCSSREPATSRSTRSRDPHHRGISGPIIEIDEFSPEIRSRKPEESSQMVNGDSDSRSRQLEADEILARELQEQFYHELPEVGSIEDDASIAWRLQQQEDTQRLSLGGQLISNHRDSAMSHLHRQHPLESFPNSSSRSINRARGSLHTRTARLRNNYRRSPTISASIGRHSRFPANMDIDTRMHILEALEAAVSDRNSMTTAGAGHFFQVQRDFNENDYEMLLALDENNHQHVGASLNQINGLPQSTVQTENFEEACAICLETPTIGDTIRHLPCLHKFHKDCIDQWLRRSTSCPVCKSGIN